MFHSHFQVPSGSPSRSQYSGTLWNFDSLRPLGSLNYRGSLLPLEALAKAGSHCLVLLRTTARSPTTALSPTTARSACSPSPPIPIRSTTSVLSLHFRSPFLCGSLSEIGSLPYFGPLPFSGSLDRSNTVLSYGSLWTDMVPSQFSPRSIISVPLRGLGSLLHFGAVVVRGSFPLHGALIWQRLALVVRRSHHMWLQCAPAKS